MSKKRTRNGWRKRGEPSMLSDAVKSFLKSSGAGMRRHQARIETRWAEAAGEALAKHTRALSFQGGVLRIGVDSSVLLSELVNVHRERLENVLTNGDAPLLLREIRFEMFTG